jgi:hypothetical protein
MTSHEVQSLVLEQIGNRWTENNPHNVDLKKSLTLPEKIALLDFSGPTRTKGAAIEAWLVLEEFPETKSGYMIVFDESSKAFGLATRDASTKRPVFLGICGDFWTTLKDM